MNILVATPGRLLQHFSQTPNFTASSLLLLVLDEADRILDMGFSSQLNAILDYLPTTRQTLLFSATQTKSVKDLARLSLTKPEYVSVHEKDELSTPSTLAQQYVVCRLTQKLDVLYSFVKSHLRCKTLVFLSSCSQVRFVTEVFKGMQPGVPIMCLHGRVKQKRRTSIYFDYLSKSSAVLISTDVCSRGLDFPKVDWVVQVDCPEDSDAYIHRVGRTARNGGKGKGLLLLTREEEAGATVMLKEANVRVKKVGIYIFFLLFFSSSSFFFLFLLKFYFRM